MENVEKSNGIVCRHFWKKIIEKYVGKYEKSYSMSKKSNSLVKWNGSTHLHDADKRWPYKLYRDNMRCGMVQQERII